MKLFELAATLSLDTTEFSSKAQQAMETGRELAETLGGEAQKVDVASTMTVAKGVAAGKAAYNAITGVARELWDFSTGIVEASAEIRAENAQFASTLGDMAHEADVAFARIGEDANILDSRLRRVGIRGFTQFKAAGWDAVEALDMMSTYTQLAADGAAFYDITMEDVGERLRSFIRGNTEAGEAIGLFTSGLDREKRAVAMYNEAWKDLTEAQRQYILLDTAKEIYDEIGATGQAAREATGWTNIIGNLNEAWTQAKAIMGGPLLERVTPALERLTNWLSSNPEKLEAVGAVLGDIAGMTFDGVISLLTFVADHGTSLAEGLAGVFNVFKLMSGDVSPVSAGQVFGGLDAKKAVDAWTKALAAGDEAGAVGLWSEAQAALGGQEAAATFRIAYEEYLQSHELEWGAQVPAEWFEGTAEKLQSDLDAMNLGTTVTVRPVYSGFSSWLGGVFGSWFGGGEEADGSHAGGLNYVPKDNYRALLHEGEAVLTRQEANVWRGGGSSDRTDDLLSAILNKLDDLGNISIFLGREKVGNAVTDTVSRNIARQTWNERYSRGYSV